MEGFRTESSKIFGYFNQENSISYGSNVQI